jgi:putative transposase
MHEIIILLVHLLITLARLARPGIVRSVIAESVMIKHQFLILNRSRQRSPNLRVSDRIIAGFCALLIHPGRLIRSAIVWGCPRIAQQIALTFDIPINKDVVRRILAAHNKPEPDSSGPSWLTFLGHMKDSLWSADLFRCESLILRTHWVLVVMDQCTRRIVGFGIHRGIVDGSALCRMFRQAVQRQPLPKYLSTDNDPLYRFHQWQANLRVLEVTEIKTAPYAPLSHPFVERFIGTIRRESLDRTLFWTRADLEAKLLDFQHFYNGYRTHAGLEGQLPEPIVDGPASPINFASYGWRKHCRGLYQTPVAT